MKIIYGCKWIFWTNAIALPELILVKHTKEKCPAWVVPHDTEHVKQWRRWLYVFYLPVYLTAGMIIGLLKAMYYFNPFESDARKAEAAGILENRARLLTFAGKVIDAGRDGDVDGGDVQEWATEAGLLVPTELTVPCADGEACVCAEYAEIGDTVTCYRLCPALLSIASQNDPNL